MSEFVIGQRWVSHTETELGLGIIVGIDGRHLTISFPAVARNDVSMPMQTAPLTRIEHKPGEAIRTQDERSFQVLKTEQHQGRLIYHARDEAGQEHMRSMSSI